MTDTISFPSLTTPPEPMASMRPQRPTALVVAGNDSSGMAGVARDTQTLFALGVHTKPMISACTAQNSEGLQRINEVSQAAFESQWYANLADGCIDVIKVGLLCSKAQVDFIVSEASELDIPVVVDPVFAASSGEYFSSEELIDQYRNYLLPLSTIITPNLLEASAICDFNVRTPQDMIAAGQYMLDHGAHAVLIKGGHLEDEESALSQDYFCSQDNRFWLSSPRVPTHNSRGTGCTLASAIAAALAQGYALEDAVVIGKMTINQGLRLAYQVGECKGPVAPQSFPDSQQDLPYLHKQIETELPLAFKPVTLPDGVTCPLGLYPVVDTSEWIERLVKLGVNTIQLRTKHLTGEALEKEVVRAIAIAKQHNARLFINDYWQLAIKHGAYGVHLGQEDLDDANTQQIHDAGLRLGISTHCHYEVARAHTYQPSYIACGPVYHTNTKQMPWIPHGPSGFAYWRKVLDYPLVAIGGIDHTRIAPMLNNQADGIAMITAITLADDPDQTVRDFLKQINRTQSSGVDPSHRPTEVNS